MASASTSKIEDNKSPTGPRIIVTGAANGIGAHCALHFAKVHNARVALLDDDILSLRALRHFLSISHSSLFQTRGEPEEDVFEYLEGDQLLFLPTDFTLEASVIASISEVTKVWLGVDGLINNPGGGPLASFSARPIEHTSLDDFNQIVQSNLSSHWIMAKHVVEELSKTGGAIVSIASTRGLQSEPGCSAAYAAAKGGVISLTHSLASNFAERRVRVNCISTGWIDVRDAIMSDVMTFPGTPVVPLRPTDHAQHWAGRVGRGEDVAKLAWFLLDYTQSGFIDGENYVLDGGMSKKMKYC
ncbi:uncharacterized protein MELLADRAFT_73096 [Melampsora larici-populina 98AG31]|uniref:Uncharacterized protein n=1 Tax=Melampsora larici-populina (strain 98AG31 / pathotype 3-4-7) TaxID=747676 RepID=F4S321_MELLP|nr:uncharacterized protein MELLADRAFT_73096 [Melampsora larici-populina 98AG31]EGG00901.1 hypothetical protein MELLADRAFT_73096 [Melampsora larici-populina 98AG31]